MAGVFTTLVWYGKEREKEIQATLKRNLKTAAVLLEKDIKVSLVIPGDYRSYKRTKSGKVHWSSSPGHPPARDSGRLSASISYVIEGTGTEMHAKVGTRVEYARALELGCWMWGQRGAHMAPRPFLMPALERCKPRIREIMGEK
jgi:phage gpG-like protein